MNIYKNAQCLEAQSKWNIMSRNRQYMCNLMNMPFWRWKGFSAGNKCGLDPVSP